MARNRRAPTISVYHKRLPAVKAFSQSFLISAFFTKKCCEFHTVCQLKFRVNCAIIQTPPRKEGTVRCTCDIAAAAVKADSIGVSPGMHRPQETRLTETNNMGLGQGHNSVFICSVWGLRTVRCFEKDLTGCEADKESEDNKRCQISRITGSDSWSRDKVRD